nr:putative nucleotidyltransferase, ribonuclease H [Tanacetum cinerariifolium]
MRTSISFSFRRPVRGGVESQQHDHLSVLLDSVILSNMEDRWFWNLNGDSVFRVKDVRILLDEAFLPKMEVPTRWIKSIPIKEKICSIAIDGESCKNLLSKALVKAFKLPTEPRHSPYQIGWIKKGSALKVTEICKVPLAIGKHYNELVTCDVVDIEACHVLLGRPWQHDMDATHQAEKKETGVSYALVMKGVNDVMENAIPSVIKPLLAEFGKIVIDDTLDALPPFRNIQHQIDLNRKTTLLVSPQLKKNVGAFVKRCVVCQEGKGKAQNTDCDDESRPEEQHLVAPYSDEEIVKEEAGNTEPIMAVEDEPLLMLGSGPNIIKKTSLMILMDTIRQTKICTNVWLKQEIVCAHRRTWDPDLPNTISISKTFNVSDIYEFHSEDVNEGKHSRTSSSKERGNDEDKIQELAEEYMVSKNK